MGRNYQLYGLKRILIDTQHPENAEQIVYQLLIGHHCCVPHYTILCLLHVGDSQVILTELMNLQYIVKLRIGLCSVV